MRILGLKVPDEVVWATLFTVAEALIVCQSRKMRSDSRGRALEVARELGKLREAVLFPEKKTTRQQVIEP